MIRFAIGSVLGLAASSPVLLGRATGFAALLLAGVGCAVGGAIAGTAIRPAASAACSFGIAFVAGNIGAMLPLVSTQATTGREPLVSVLAGFAVSYSIVLAVASSIGLAGTGVRGRALTIGALGFVAGGIATAVCLVALLDAGLIGGSPSRAFGGFAIALTLPWIIGAAFTDQRNERRDQPEHDPGDPGEQPEHDREHEHGAHAADEHAPHSHGGLL